MVLSFAAKRVGQHVRDPIPGNVTVNKPGLLYGLVVGYVLFWSLLAAFPVDRGDWFLENLLTSAVGLLLATYRQFQFSTMSYIVITAFLTLHAIGAHSLMRRFPSDFDCNTRLDLVAIHLIGSSTSLMGFCSSIHCGTS